MPGARHTGGGRHARGGSVYGSYDLVVAGRAVASETNLTRARARARALAAERGCAVEVRTDQWSGARLLYTAKAAKTNPEAGYRAIRGAPARAQQPLDWAKKHGRPVGIRWQVAAHKLPAVFTAEGIHLGKKLGCGTFGCAYLDADNSHRVIKITGDPSEASAAARVIVARSEGHRLPAVVRFFSVRAVLDNPLFVIRQERLIPLARRQFEMIAENADAMYDTAYDSDAAQVALARTLERKYRVAAALTLPILRTFRQLRAIGVDYHDLHEGNVLRDAAGRFKIIDLGISRTGPIRIPQVRA